MVSSELSFSDNGLRRNLMSLRWGAFGFSDIMLVLILIHYAVRMAKDLCSKDG